MGFVNIATANNTSPFRISAGIRFGSKGIGVGLQKGKKQGRVFCQERPDQICGGLILLFPLRGDVGSFTGCKTAEA